MAFSLDRIVNYVKIDEPDLISIHRSTHTIIPTNDICLGHLCEAFICAAREKDNCRVYVALYDTGQKSNLVFVADPVSLKEYNTLIREAEAFLNGLGFSMEPVNVKFSPATRQVVIRDIKVMRQPKHTAAQQQAEPEATMQVVAAKMPVMEAAPATGIAQQPTCDTDARDRALLNTRLAETVTALEQVRAQKDELSRKASEELKTLKAERDTLRRELETAARSRRDAEMALARQEEGDSGKVAALESQRDTLQAELAAARLEAEALRRTLAETRAELGNENSRLHQAIEQMGQERDNAVQALSNEVASLRGAVSAANGALDVERNRNGEQERSAAVLSNEIEALRAALTMADKSLTAERLKTDSAHQEMAALKRHTAAELNSLNKKVNLLADEKRRLESMVAEIKVKAREEIERLRHLNQSQRRAAVKKVRALEENARQLAEEGSAMASATQVSPREQPATSSRKKTPKADAAAVTSGISDGPFAYPGLSDSMSFEPDTTLKGIPYGTPEDVIEVHRSFNKIQAAPNGKMVQSCDGFVCKVTDGGQTYVYTAWLMNVTNEVLVCRPDHRPENANAANCMLREGIGYFERVGFLMDRLEIETDPKKRQRQFDSLPVFCRIITECAA